MRRIEFLEKELDQAKAEVARGDEVRRELREKQAECKELAEALEELEAQQGAEIQRAVEAARKEWQAEVAHRERGDKTTPVGDPRAEAPTGALPGASVRRQSPGDYHSLLLSARKFSRQGTGAGDQSYLAQQTLNPRLDLGFRRARALQYERHVLSRGETLEQSEVLEHVADSPPELRDLTSLDLA